MVTTGRMEKLYISTHDVGGYNSSIKESLEECSPSLNTTTYLGMGMNPRMPAIGDGTRNSSERLPPCKETTTEYSSKKGGAGGSSKLSNLMPIRNFQMQRNPQVLNFNHTRESLNLKKKGQTKP